jgi:hypothetical protein
MEEDVPMPRLSPTVELGIIERNLMALGFPPQTICLLLRHSDFPTFEFRTHQICFLNQSIRETFNRTTHLSELSTLFDIAERTVPRPFARRPEEPLLLGHRRALDADIESSLITMLVGIFQRGEPMTNKELLKTVRSSITPSSQMAERIHSSGAILMCCKNAANFH